MRCAREAKYLQEGDVVRAIAVDGMREKGRARDMTLQEKEKRAAPSSVLALLV